MKRKELSGLWMTASVALCVLAVSCTGLTENEEKADDPQKPNISSRNYSINESNSYSKLFLDSMDVVNYFSQNGTPDSTQRRIISFYNTRNYQYAWFAENGATEPMRGFWNMYKYYITYEDYGNKTSDSLNKVIDNLLAQNRSSWNEDSKQLKQLELGITKEYISFFTSAFSKGTVKRKEMERFIPYMRFDALSVADSLVNKKHKDGKYFEDENPAYGKLKQELRKYLDIQKSGGWPTLDKDPKALQPGANNNMVALLKQRLYLSGDLATADTTTTWTDSLTMAVKNMQERFGMKPDGKIRAEEIAALNIPVEKRVGQLLINLYRMQWDIAKPEGRYIEVNIPEFMLHVSENGNKVFDMVVVVGKDGNNTTIFADNLDQIVFAPYWNIPASIVKEEIEPAIAKNPRYLEAKNMEAVEGGNGYRQKPGPGNALGKVKFLFPNAYDIYFHDTPSKSLFNREERAFSHGCIRLQDPYKMAAYLLNNDPKWTPEKIRAAMDGTEEQWVKLDKPVPVLITYYTAWVDDKGRMNFRDDVYGHDEEQSRRLFTNQNAPAQTVVKKDSMK